MNKLLIAILLFAGTAAAQDRVRVSVKDFKPSFGLLKGSLTYLDYTSGRSFSMPANVTIRKEVADKRRLILELEYPNEPRANGNDTVVISDDGSQIDGAAVITKERSKEGLRVVTEKKGVDGNNNKAATIRHIYLIGKTSFTSRKEVKFDGEDKFILRNEYKMTR